MTSSSRAIAIAPMPPSSPAYEPPRHGWPTFACARAAATTIAIASQNRMPHRILTAMIRAIALVLVACGAPRPSSPPDHCAALLARFDATLARASNTCTTAVDCGCIPNGLGSRPACNGVADRATATELDKLGDELVAQCPTSGTSCPGNVCVPDCAAGRCR